MRTVKRLFFITLLLLVAYVTLSAGFLSGSEICTTCGTESRAISLYGVTFRRAIEPTPLSELLAKYRMITPHSHQWLFEAGSGMPPFGPFCALGTGRHIGSAARQRDNTRFLEALISRAGPAAAQPYIQNLLFRSTCQKWEFALIETEFSSIDPGDPQSFAAWWTARHAEFDTAIAP
jgi:hypothetical protein